MPFVFNRRNVIHTVDRTRTIDPAFREPIDPGVLEFMADAERQLVEVGFSAPHRITTSQELPLTAVGSLLEHPVEGELATVTAVRGAVAGKGEPAQSGEPGTARVALEGDSRQG